MAADALPILETAICSNGRNCRTCRNVKGGAAFRATVAQAFRVPPGWPECPFGRPWGYGAAQAPLIALPRSLHASIAAVRPANAPAGTAPSPLDWPLLGPALWADLHRTALAGLLTLPWLDTFAARIPCGDCKQHWLAWTAEHPPDLSSAEGAWEWTWRGHQAVNRRLGRTGMTLDEARRRWG